VLNNITNFFNLIKTGKVKTQLDASDLLPIGTRDLRFIGQYQPTMIKYSDLASQILAGPLTVGVTSIASGTVNRVLFEGTNNKLSESANLTWDNANQNFRVVGNLFAGLNNYCSLSNALSGYGAVGSNYYYEGNIAKRTNPDLASQLDFSNGFKFKNAGGGLAGSTITWSDLGYWNGATGNLLVGTTTDAGFRLDVNGTARVVTSIEVNGKRLSGGASALTSNTAYGANTLTVASVNGDNTAIGYIALQNNTGTMNTSVGSYSLTQNSTGQLNTAIGGYAGSSVTSGSNNILVGYNSQLGSGGQSNQIVIGVGASGLGSNTTVIGNSSITHGRWWGNLLIGTSIDAGFTLDVNGTARVSGALTVSGNQILFSGSTTNTYITQNIGTGVGNFSAATCVQFQVNTFPKIIVRDTGSSRASTLIVGDNVATTESAHSSALLEVRSSSSYIKGFLPPRMTQTERNSIATPAVGLMVYQTDATEGLYVYKSTGWTLNS